MFGAKQDLKSEVWSLISDPNIGLVNYDNMFEFARDVSKKQNLEVYQDLY